MRRRFPRRLLGVLVAATAAFALFSSAPAAVQPLSTSTPVVFVHGCTGNASNRVTAMSVFRLNGWSSSNLFAYAAWSASIT